MRNFKIKFFEKLLHRLNLWKTWESITLPSRLQLLNINVNLTKFVNHCFKEPFFIDWRVPYNIKDKPIVEILAIQRCDLMRKFIYNLLDNNGSSTRWIKFHQLWKKVRYFFKWRWLVLFLWKILQSHWMNLSNFNGTLFRRYCIFFA